MNAPRRVLCLLGAMLSVASGTGCSSTVAATDAGADVVSDAAQDVVTDAGGCVLPNGSRCAVGATCPAGDGCNQCTCSATGPLACTRLACVTPCAADSDCPAGQGCDGPPGCAVPWTCGHLLCASVASTWCDCANHTFTTTTACARRPYQHAGACEPITEPDAGTCGPVGAMCTVGDVCCSGWCPARGGVFSVCAALPPGGIACNDRTCDAATEYCELTYSDVPTPDSATCRPLPTACAGAAACGCAAAPSPCGGCVVRSPGVLVFRCPGG